MVVPGAMRDDDIGLPRPDLPRDLAAVRLPRDAHIGHEADDDRASDRPGRRGRDRVPDPRRRLLGQRRGDVGRAWVGPGASGVGAFGDGCDPAVHCCRPVCERRRGVRGGRGPVGLRGRQVRAAGPAEADLGPRQRLPPKPKHPSIALRALQESEPAEVP